MSARRLYGQGKGIWFSPIFLSLLLLFLMTFRVTVVSADMANQFGISPRGIGMANAVSAVIDDYAAVYYNPAGLALSQDTDLTIGYLYSHPRVKVRDQAGIETIGFNKGTNAILLGFKGSLRSLLPEKWARNIGLGLLAGVPENLKKAAMVETSYYKDMLFPVFGRVPDILIACGGLGIELLPKRIYIGAGVRVALTLGVQDLLVTMDLGKNENVYQNFDGNVDTEARPIAGLIVRPWDPLRFSFVWRRGGPTARIDVNGFGIVQLGNLQLPLSASLVFRDFYVPDEFSGSIAYQPLEKLLLTVEVTYAKWSSYNIPYNEKTPGDPFQDIVVPQVGVEYSLLRFLKIWMGYYYQPSPVKFHQPFTQFLDTDEHVFSTGMEFSRHIMNRFPDGTLKLQFFFQYQHLPHRSLETVNGQTSIWGYLVNMGASVQLLF